jgi:transposase-like protein
VTDIALPTHEQARTLTDRIKVAVEGTWQLIREAYTTRTWAVLGYDTWDDYCTEEFPTARLRLPREERQEVVASLRDSGLSLRAIASATGMSPATVMRDARVSDETPPEITGADGKTYAATHPATELNTWTPPEADAEDNEPVEAELVDEPPMPEPPKAKRRPLPEAFADASRDLTRAAERLHRLTEDDRFNRNRDHTHHQMPELITALEHTTGLIQAMNLAHAQANEEARRWWATSLNNISDALSNAARSIEQENQ